MLQPEFEVLEAFLSKIQNPENAQRLAGLMSKVYSQQLYIRQKSMSENLN